MEKKGKRVSILGCGWLGLPLCQLLVKKGYEVKASTTTESKLNLIKAVGAKAYNLKLVPEPEGDGWDDFLDTDYLIISIPTKRKISNMHSFHPTQMQYLVKKVLKTPLRKVIYLSSTSVYPNTNSVVTESSKTHDPETDGHAAIMAESIIRTTVPFDATVLRLGGLMGYDRISAKYFIGRKDLTTGEIPVNLIHRDDAIRVIEKVIEKERWNIVYNVVAPEHPTKEELYIADALKAGFEPPEFVDSEPHPYKIISSEKMQKELQYTFKYPDPLLFEYTTLKDLE